MTALVTLHNRIFSALETHVAPALIPTLARFVFAATLLVYYLNSGRTKLGDGILGFWNVDMGAYIQILPRAFEQVGYDPSALGTFADLTVRFGTIAEFLLPVAILIGLFTRLAAIGMIGFVIVQTWVDAVGHGAELGMWFDRLADGVLDERAFWVFLLIVLVLRGAGPISVDALLSRRQDESSAAFTSAPQPR